MSTHASSDTPPVDPAHITHAARDTLTVRRVFGESYERDGTLVIPVATVWGGTGSGWGSGAGELSGKGAADWRRRGGAAAAPEPAAEVTDGDAGSSSDPGSGNAGGEAGGEGSGGGGGFGVRVVAKGVYVVDDGGVRWQPALDLNRVILGGQALGAVVAFSAALAWGLSRLRRR
ncbi:hypothetical protein [Cellulosimicrobium protaetiae]|uniref:Sporulation protein n=1 Tax=Cellulosimicrobium protaetiae TaxID=2587808 RepID=A0A6M5UFR9_9MICO|nr:hypothetical protein [Cellulosimicrobium protaetiae]QJW37000.1 hypothetical protein FIC82_013225 [Cellulosimicrobium protaetiae]